MDPSMLARLAQPPLIFLKVSTDFQEAVSRGSATWASMMQGAHLQLPSVDVGSVQHETDHRAIGLN